MHELLKTNWREGTKKTFGGRCHFFLRHRLGLFFNKRSWFNSYPNPNPNPKLSHRLNTHLTPICAAEKNNAGGRYLNFKEKITFLESLFSALSYDTSMKKNEPGSNNKVLFVVSLFSSPFSSLPLSRSAVQWRSVDAVIEKALASWGPRRKNQLQLVQLNQLKPTGNPGNWNGPVEPDQLNSNWTSWNPTGPARIQLVRF